MKITRRSFMKRIRNELVDVSLADIETIERAFLYAKEAHDGQTRASGEPYFEGHCVPVALHVLELELDSTLICAALLHDTIEDTAVTREDIEALFGSEVAQLPEGDSKFAKLH